jgi:hypothetical protein
VRKAEAPPSERYDRDKLLLPVQEVGSIPRAEQLRQIIVRQIEARQIEARQIIVREIEAREIEASRTLSRLIPIPGRCSRWLQAINPATTLD